MCRRSSAASAQLPVAPRSGPVWLARWRGIRRLAGRPTALVDCSLDELFGDDPSHRAEGGPRDGARRPADDSAHRCAAHGACRCGRRGALLVVALRVVTR